MKRATFSTFLLLAAFGTACGDEVSQSDEPTGGEPIDDGDTDDDDVPAEGGGGQGGSGLSGGGGQGGEPPEPIDPVGNCVLDAGEQCDDCNALDGDGCDAGGQREAGWACDLPGEPCLPLSGFTAATPAQVGYIGSGGGSDFSRSCPEGSVLIGVIAEDAASCACASPANQLGSLQPLCATVAAKAAGRLGWDAPLTPLDRVGGLQGVGAQLGMLACPVDEFLVGVHAGGGGVYGDITSIGISCSPFALETDAAGHAMVSGTAWTSATLGSSAPPLPLGCPADQLATEIGGRHGAVIDGVSVSCSTLSPTFCGDGVVDAHEACDDGNVTPGDGCDSFCGVE